MNRKNANIEGHPLATVPSPKDAVDVVAALDELGLPSTPEAISKLLVEAYHREWQHYGRAGKLRVQADGTVVVDGTGRKAGGTKRGGYTTVAVPSPAAVTEETAGKE